MKRTIYKIRWTGDGWENVYMDETPEAGIVAQLQRSYETQREALIEEALSKSDYSLAKMYIEVIKNKPLH
jgi:hypothetical protein